MGQGRHTLRSVSDPVYHLQLAVDPKFQVEGVALHQPFFFAEI